MIRTMLRSSVIHHRQIKIMKHIKYLIRPIVPGFLSCLILCWAGSAGAQVLRVDAGTHLVNQGGVVLENTGLVNNGVVGYTNTAGFILKGNNNQAISGTGSTSFYSLQLSKQNNSIVTLQKNISVAGPLLMSSGLLDMTDRSIQLIYPNGAVQDEKESSRIYSTGTGEIYISLPLANPSGIMPGNLGAALTSNLDLGVTTIRRGHQVQADAQGRENIKRYFKIESNVADPQLTLTLTYFDMELNGMNESSLVMIRKTNGNWQELLPANPPMNNSVTRTGITSLGMFSLTGAAASVLPLDLVAFNASCVNGTTRLQWITANEVNTKQFLMEQSSNGINWQNIRPVAAKNNAEQQQYSETVPAGSGPWFRLKMEDADGSFSYSPVQRSACSGSSKVMVGPNPTTGLLTITSIFEKADQLSVQVLDAKGGMVLQKHWPAPAGTSVAQLNLANQPAGVYLLHISGKEGYRETFRVVKR
jgi:hypothetical protein